ncbi:hypothetical protein [Motilimonas sp. E26]|uniref:hypothetical protein n=1 Tax=Motilimonas sp. E26 TaxID=2865674 RepID=UPI001E2D0340|nr:hypothetical protein [Motilimonas sp. E26]MCE0557309.1 hypothetical protein [Motilimonas sp. E26]
MVYEENIIKIALYVACNDGVLSEEEESQLIKSCLRNFPSIDQKKIDFWIEKFFEEDLLLEDYCDKIAELEDRLTALNIATETASADGLELRENLALSRVMNYWDIPWEEITRA